MSRVWDESLNPYDVLEIANGLEASEADIKKAYRKLARLKHPDKNPTARIEEFHLIQSAYEILTDADARAAYDTVIKARQLHEERWRKQSEKRRRMKEDLEQKEKAWSEERREEASAQAALQKELERLRQKLEKQHKDKTQIPRPSNQPSLQNLHRMMKIKWTDSETAWNEEKLRDVLQTWTHVKALALRRKRGHVYTAVVELSSAEDVAELIAHQESCIEGTFKGKSSAIEALLKFTLKPVNCDVPAESVPSTNFSPASLSEAEVLAKMRRAAGMRG